MTFAKVEKMIPLRLPDLQYTWNRLRLWALRDSNPRPSRCKRDALNQLRLSALFSSVSSNSRLPLHVQWQK
jgi:hypothetical protein